MTTVLNPSGSPEIIFNRGGVTISSVDAGGTFGDPTGAPAIVRYSEVTVVLVSCADDSHVGVILPDDAEIGDRVEVYYTQNSVDVTQVRIWAPAGETIGASNALTAQRVVFRKTSASGWWYLDQ